MLGLRRRKRIEGWAVEVSEADVDPERASLFRRIADNNKAWVLCLVAIVALTFVLIKNAHRTIEGDIPVTEPLEAPSEFRDRGRYAQFEADFASDARFAEWVIEARFLAPGRFRLVVQSGISADDIDYMAKIAAERIRYVFHHRSVVYVYKKSPNSDVRTLVATARWQPDKNGYMVRFHPGAERSP